MFSVDVLNDAGEVRTIRFDKFEVSIGRDPTNDVVLPGDNVSGRHARLTFREGRFLLSDQKSTNGTRVNRREIKKPQLLDDADEIDICGFKITAPRMTSENEGRIVTIGALRAYLVAGLRSDLEAHGDLGDNEATFQGAIFSILGRRLGEPFRAVLEKRIAGTDQKADIVIDHAKESVAIEIKPSGGLEPLLDDVRKLKGYLRRKGSGITFAVLVYRCRRPAPAELWRLIRGIPGIALVRVHRSK